MARIEGMDRDALLDRARGRGVNPLVYWGLRAILQPFFHLYWRLSRIGREHIPARGPFIIASNHRSFLDPFVIAVMARRPIYFMTKKEAFINRPAAWRSRPARPSCRWPSSARRTFARGGASARTRCASAPARR